ncbi:MAG: hypothetical protein ACXAAI_12300, partial [Promethearchaeota archaeon]
NDFINLRKSPFNDLNFMIRSPIRIIKIHMKAITHKKLWMESRSPTKQWRDHISIEHTTPDHTRSLRI